MSQTPKPDAGITKILKERPEAESALERIGRIAKAIERFGEEKKPQERPPPAKWVTHC